MNFISSDSKKLLGVFALIMINIIAIDSLRNLPVNASMGLTLPFYYILSCVVFLIPCALVTSELSTHFPHAGGAYGWIRRAFGLRIAFTAIWLQWIYNVFWYPTILAFVATNVAYLIDPELTHHKIYMLGTIIGLFWISTALNACGVRVSSWVSTIGALIGTIIPMLVITILGVLWYIQGKPLGISWTSWHDWLPALNNMTQWSFIVMVFFSLFGLEMSAVHAESVQNPEKSYPKALLYSSIFIVLSLMFSSLSIVLMIPSTQLNILSGLDQAFAVFFESQHMVYLLPWMMCAIIIGSFCAMTTWVFGPTQALVVALKEIAALRKKNSLPHWLSQTNRFNSPARLLWTQAVLVLVICMLFLIVPSFNASYWILCIITAQLAILFYILLFLSARCLHGQLKPNPKAFLVPQWIMRIIIPISLLSCVLVFGLGFIPPESVGFPSVHFYVLFLVCGLVCALSIPFFLTRQIQDHQRSPLNTMGKESH